MSTDNGGGLENQNVRQALKNTGLAEAAKGLKVEGGTNRTIDFKSTGEWLAQQEAHVSSTPTKDVARIDYTLNYLAELNTKAGQINNETLTQNIDAHTANIRKRIDASTNLITDLTAEPQGHPDIAQTDLAASICKARVLSEIKNITSIPKKDGSYPTPEEAIAQLHSKTKEARGRIVESRIHTATRMVEDPASYLSESVNTWQEFSDAQDKITQKAETELAQLQLLQHATHYELTQPGNAGKVAREKAFTAAWKENVEQVKKPGRAVKIEALYENAVKRSPTNEKPLKKNLDENKIQYRGYEAPMPEGKSKPSVKVEIPTPIPNPEPIRGLIIQEDLRKLDRETIDKEHVHWHPRAMLITDSHGMGYKGLEKRIRAELGPKVKVEFKNGLAYVDGQELPIYHGGDALDPNKVDVMLLGLAKGLKSKTEYRNALKDTNHKLHGEAVKLEKMYEKFPDHLDKVFQNAERIHEDYNIDEAREIYEACLSKGRALLGNHEAMFISGWESSNTQLLAWLCDTNLGELTFNNLTGDNFSAILKEFNIPGMNEQVIEKLDADTQAKLCARLRSSLHTSDKAKNLNANIVKNVKLYNVVNGIPQVHSSIDVDKNGKLIPPLSRLDRKKKYPGPEYADFWKNVDSLTGVEALDYLESEMKKNNPAAKDFIAMSGNLKPKVKPTDPDEAEGGIFARKDFHETMINNGQFVMDQIGDQLRPKGVKNKPKFMASGHEPRGGGSMTGTHLLRADDDKGTVVRIDLTYDKGNELVSSISATHNFGQIAPIVNKI